MHVTLVCIPAPHLLTTSTSLPLGSELPPLPDGIPVTLVCIPTLHLLTTSTSLPLGSELPPLPDGMPDACVHPNTPLAYNVNILTSRFRAATSARWYA